MFHAHLPACQCPFASVLPTTMVTQPETLGATPAKTGCHTAWVPDCLCLCPFQCPIIMDIVGFHHIDARLLPFPHWRPSWNHSTPSGDATWVSVYFRFHIRMLPFMPDKVWLDNGERTSAIVEGVHNSINMGGGSSATTVSHHHYSFNWMQTGVSAGRSHFHREGKKYRTRRSVGYRLSRETSCIAGV